MRFEPGLSTLVADAASREPTVLSADLNSTSRRSRPQKKTGPGWIRTSDPGIMSPLTSESKSIQNKHLQKAKSGVDRKTDSRMSISAPATAEIGVANLPRDLAEIVTLWPDLPDYVKVTITTLVQAHAKEGR